MLLKKSNWLAFVKQIYNSEENFLTKGYGLALLKNDELISEAFACYIGGGYVETGSITSEKYRGMGYATVLRAFLIKESLSRNLYPETTCNVDNIGSAKTSKKLGFKEKKRYLFLVI
jgi:predicted GNAT family acetyltransferase